MSSAVKVKKPRSNFLIFCDEKRPIIRAANAELKSTEVIQECAKMWKALSDDERQKYTKQYEALKKAHYAAHPKVEKVKSTRPKSAYINFCGIVREATKKENPGVGPKDLMRAIAVKWSALSDTEKLAYKVGACSIKSTTEKKPARKPKKVSDEPVLKD